MSRTGSHDDADRWSGYFSGFRHGGAPTLYPSRHDAVSVDVLEIGFVFAALILLLAFILILPGYRSGVDVSPASRIVVPFQLLHVSMHIEFCVHLCHCKLNVHKRACA